MASAGSEAATGNPDAQGALQQHLNATSQRETQAYFATFRRYVGLFLHTPLIGTRFFQCNQPDWSPCFEYWNITWLRIFIICFVTHAVWVILVYLAKLAVINLLLMLVLLAIHLLFMLIFSHLSWYCVVVNSGCCGSVGYFCWAVAYLLSLLSAFVRMDIMSLTYLVLAVPTIYELIACWKLGTASEIAGATQSGIANGGNPVNPF